MIGRIGCARLSGMGDFTSVAASVGKPRGLDLATTSVANAATSFRAQRAIIDGGIRVQLQKQGEGFAAKSPQLSALAARLPVGDGDAEQRWFYIALGSLVGGEYSIEAVRANAQETEKNGTHVRGVDTAIAAFRQTVQSTGGGAPKKEEGPSKALLIGGAIVVVVGGVFAYRHFRS